MKATLWVDIFSAESSEWNVSGSTPYIDDSAGYVESDKQAEEDYYFGFETSGLSGIISQVILYIECMQASGGDDSTTVRLLADGVSEYQAGVLYPNGGAYTYQTLPLTSVFNTWPKIDSCSMSIISGKVGGAFAYQYVRRAYLYIEYSELLEEDLYESLDLSSEILKEIDMKISESFSLDDLFSRTVNFFRTLYSTLSLSSSSERDKLLESLLIETLGISPWIKIWGRIPWSLKLTDSINFYIAKTKSLFESLSLSDVFNKVSSFFRNFLETLDLSPSRFSSFYKTFEETLNQQSQLIFKVIKRLFNSLSIQDSFQIGQLLKFLFESLKIESIKKLTFRSLRSEIIILSSQISKVISKYLNEIFSLLDQVTPLGILSKFLSESLSLFSQLRKGIGKYLFDNLNLEDLIIPISQKFKSLFEILSQEDLLYKLVGKHLPSETLSLPEILIKQFQKFLTEGFHLEEIVEPILTLLKELTEILSFSISLSKKVSKKIIENLYLSDFLGKIVFYLRSFYETLNLEDILETYKGFAKTLFEYLHLEDSFSRTINFFRIFYENLILEDQYRKIIFLLIREVKEYWEKIVDQSG